MLLAAAVETFNGPSLTALIALAREGQDTAPAGINTMVRAFEAQLQSGPLADLNAGTVDGNGFVSEVQSLETSYEQSVDSQLSPEFPNVERLLDLQGQRIVADMIALNQQNAVGLVSTSDLATQAQTAIGSLTAGPIFSLETSLSAYRTATRIFESELNTLAQALGSSGTTTLTPTDVGPTLTAEAEAYRANMHAALQVTHPHVSNSVDTAVTTLENTGLAITQDTSSADAQSVLTTAITTFDTAVLDTTGLFGSRGAVAKAVARHAFSANLTLPQAATTISSVSGTAAGGTATLTATLMGKASGTGISGDLILFTLDGAFAGTAVTDSNGVATLSGVATSDAAGADTGGVVASFAGDINDGSSHASGDLTVSAGTTATTLGRVSGTAAFGGTATLNATLTNTTTGAGISGETVRFTLDGTSVGSATTNSGGGATLTGVSTSDAVGTDTGGVVASFAGDATYAAAANATGNLVVSQAASTLGNASGTAAFGGTATLTATLTNPASAAGLSGQTVSFALDGTAAGTAVTNSSGVATLTGVATSHTAGTDTGGVVASFAGNANVAAATSATGNLIVSQAATSLANVSGTATGGLATLMATLMSLVTNQGVPGEIVAFTLDGASVGNAVTDSHGVATLSNVPTSDATGTHSGAVVAVFTGITNLGTSDGSGALTVS